MTLLKAEHGDSSTENPASNNVAKEQTPMKENRNTCPQNQDKVNMEHSGDLTSCSMESKKDSLVYETENLYIQEHSISTSRTVLSKEENALNINHELCEKSELYSKPDVSVQETKITPLTTCASQEISETNNHQENEMVLKSELIDVQANLDTAGECENGHKSDPKELVTVKTECGNSLKYMLESTNTGNSVAVGNKKRDRRIVKNKMEKDEKRRQREMEFLNNLVPKEQRVQIVDHSTFQKIFKDSNTSKNENKSLGLSFDEFPELTLPKNKEKFSVNLNENFSEMQDYKATRELGKPPDNVKQEKRMTESHSTKAVKENEMPREFERKLNSVKQYKCLLKPHNAHARQIVHKHKTTREFDRTSNHAKPLKNLSEYSSVATHEVVHKNEMRTGVFRKPGINGGVRKAGKPPKKRDPIKIDILHCIKMVRSKDMQVDSKKRSSSVEKGSKLKENSVISGNELDASNPQRSKGKKREQPRKKKPSKLKLIILQGRELKKQLKELQYQKLIEEKQEQIKISESKDDITSTDSELNKVKYKDSTQEIKDQCMFYSSSDCTSVSCDDQSSIDQNGRPHILHRNMCFSAEQQSTDTIHLTSLNSVAKGKLEVDSENHSLSVMAGGDEKKFIPLRDSKNECHHSSQNKQCHSSLINGISAFASTESVSHQGNQDNTSSGDDAKKFTPLQNVGNVCLHSSENRHNHTSVIIDICAVPVQSPSHQKSQEKPFTNKASDFWVSSNEPISGLHTRRFRPYCDHIITSEINSSVRSLVQDIVKFHDRHYERDPVKANARRRHVTGLREVLKYLNLKRLKLVIIAPDLEIIEGKGGICDLVFQLKEGARTQEIPYVFALDRKTLGKITFKKVPVSCIGVLSYDGTEKNFHAMMEALPEARNLYQKALAEAIQKDGCNSEMDVNKQVIASVLSKLTEKSTPVPKEETNEV